MRISVSKNMKDYIQLLILKLYWFFVSFWRGSMRFLKEGSSGDNMQKGELVVTGMDRVEIELGERCPREIIIMFIDEEVCIPCNPKHHDHHHHKIREHFPHTHSEDHHHHAKKHHNKYVLEIGWNVSGVRVIEWTVKY